MSFPYKNGYGMDEDDFFSTLIWKCMEANKICARHGAFIEKASRMVEEALCEYRREYNRLYSPYRSMSLDKCYGESETPMIEWLPVEKERGL